MKYSTGGTQGTKPFCACGSHYLCTEAQHLMEWVDAAENFRVIGAARLFAMILCAHRRVEIKRITGHSRNARLPYYGGYLKRENRLLPYAPTITPPID